LEQTFKDARPVIVVIIPAFNEADSIARVLADIPDGLAAGVVVVDNNSSDATADNARKAGVTVLREPRQGYGYACARGIEHCNALPRKPDIVVFLDADYADFPEEMSDLVKPIIEQGFDMVIGSRALGRTERGAMTPQQIFGNRLATSLIRLLYKTSFTDLGPFRAIKFDRLMALGMRDRSYGWTVEMQVKAVRQGLRIREVPVSYRARIGRSKISGTVRGTVLGGYRILATIFKHR
jgi:glycosyltransferase involved in cell wall biosynthesis